MKFKFATVLAALLLSSALAFSQRRWSRRR